jgi:hypothetical protein
MNSQLPHFLFGIAISTVTLLLPISTSRGDDESLDKELRTVIVEHVLPLMEKRGHGAVAIGGFTAATSVKGSAGPEIQLKLSRLLQQSNVVIAADSYRYEINGNYLPYNDPQSNLYGVKLITRIVDADDGTTLGEFPRFIFGAESVPRLLGLNVSSKGGSDPKVQSVSFKKSVQSPETFLAGTLVAASPCFTVFCRGSSTSSWQVCCITRECGFTIETLCAARQKRHLRYSVVQQIGSRRRGSAYDRWGQRF